MAGHCEAIQAPLSQPPLESRNERRELLLCGRSGESKGGWVNLDLPAPGELADMICSAER